jgi:hypothetical protein
MTKIGLIIVAVLSIPTLLGWLTLWGRPSNWRLPHSLDYDHNWYERILLHQDNIEFGGYEWQVNFLGDQVLLSTHMTTVTSSTDIDEPKYNLAGSQYKAATILAKKIQLRRSLASLYSDFS